MLPAIVKENLVGFNFYPDRSKAYGRMWGGSAEAVVNGYNLGLELWHHGGDEETKESLVDELRIKFVNGKDAYWRTIQQDGHLWLHPEGWFGNRELENVLKDNMHYRVFSDAAFILLGFVKVF